MNVKLAASLSTLALAVCCLTDCRIPRPRRVTCVDFEPPLAVGTQYGAGNHVPGDLALTSNLIRVFVDPFRFTAGGGTFQVASIESQPVPGGGGQSLRSNNIDLRFDFTALPYPVSRVTFAFLDLGGSENLGVNGSPVSAGELSAAPGTIGGASVSVTTQPATGGQSGSADVRGPVQVLVVGGQELWIDRVCAKQ